VDEKNFIDHLYRSIPSIIGRVTDPDPDKRWTPEYAIKFFRRDLDKIRNGAAKNDLLNNFNHELNKAKQRRKGNVSPNEYLLQSGGDQPVVRIQGPVEIGAGTTISLEAQTDGIGEDESYSWQIQGNVAGVTHTLQDIDRNGGSHALSISATPDCDSGAMYITATGLMSNISGGTSVFVQGQRDQDRNQQNKKEPEEQASEPESPEAPEQQGEGEQAEAADQAKQSFMKRLLSDKARKAMSDAAKKAIKAALSALWKLILAYWPYILAALLIIAVGIALYVAFVQKAASGENGSTIHQQAASTTDAAILQKTILAAGDADAKAKITDQVFGDIQKQLLLMQDSPEPTKTKVANLLTKIDQFMTSKDTDLGNEIISDLKDLLNSAGEQAPTIQVATKAPIDNVKDYNFDLHYGTPLRKDMPTNGSGHATYMYYGQGKADAVDLYADSGSSVYAVFAGKITNISDDGTGHKKIAILNGDYEILYANIDLSQGLAVGQSVTTGQVIGKVVDINGQDQVHIELSYQCQPIVTTELDKIDYDTSQKPWGQYLWDHMKQILNIK
jgi:murein DD-endopeptidase MepM/ murein hydrolase activator NlpD